jgi:hypothetical protein
MGVNYITDHIKALIGRESELEEATHPVEASEVRRFHHATMDPAPRYWDAAWASGSRYGSLVAPPAFPVHAFRRPADAPDPLDPDAERDFGGMSKQLRPGLPIVDVPLERMLSGGYEYEFFRYARIGEKVFRRSRYRDIYQRDGKSGPMVFVLVEETYTTGAGEPLLTTTNTIILR